MDKFTEDDRKMLKEVHDLLLQLKPFADSLPEQLEQMKKHPILGSLFK